MGDSRRTREQRPPACHRQAGPQARFLPAEAVRNREIRNPKLEIRKTAIGLRIGGATKSKANSVGPDCRVASLLAMTPPRGTPAMSNEPNFGVFRPGMRGTLENKANPFGREARHWGFRIVDSRRRELGMSNKANLGRRARQTKPISCVLGQERGSSEKTKPIGTGGRTKQTQFRPFWPKNEGRDGKQSQFGGSRLPRRFAPRNDTAKQRARNVKQSQFRAFLG